MRHIATSAVLALTFIFAATPAQGSTIDVRVLSAKFTATVTVAWRFDPATTETKTSTGPDPVSESLHRAYCEDLTGVFLCESGFKALADAAAGFLDVSTSGSADQFTHAIATADSEWTFSPLWDGTAVIDILGESSLIESSQFASLFDLTADEQVWQFSTSNAFGMYEVVPTVLNAQHVYAMHLTAFAAGREDHAFSELHVSGIRAVPDTVDSFVCLCMGLLVAVLGKWKLRT